MDARQLTAVGICLIGIWFLCNAFSDIVYTLVSIINNDEGKLHTSLIFIINVGINLVIAILLILFRNKIAYLLFKPEDKKDFLESSDLQIALYSFSGIMLLSFGIVSFLYNELTIYLLQNQQRIILGLPNYSLELRPAQWATRISKIVQIIMGFALFWGAKALTNIITKLRLYKT